MRAVLTKLLQFDETMKVFLTALGFVLRVRRSPDNVAARPLRQLITICLRRRSGIQSLTNDTSGLEAKEPSTSVQMVKLGNFPTDVSPDCAICWLGQRVMLSFELSRTYGFVSNKNVVLGSRICIAYDPSWYNSGGGGCAFLLDF